jgi:hypothetical protein
MDTARRDRGSIVIGWLTKLAVVLSLVGIALFDAVAVGVNHVSASDDANSAAEAAGASWRASHDIQAAYAAAVQSVTSDSERVLAHGFAIDPDGTVHLLLRRETHTLVLHHVGPLKKYEFVVTAGTANPPTL